MMRVEDRLSPNHSHRPDPDDISLIVVHSTASSNLDATLAWLCDQTAQVSAHYVVDKGGRIVRLVDEPRRAWHAGKSSWKGRSDVNDFSVGIELLNLNDGADPYPMSQVEAVAGLCRDIMRRWPRIGLDGVVGHFQVAPGRKSDPRGFPWGRFRELLTAEPAAVPSISVGKCHLKVFGRDLAEPGVLIGGKAYLPIRAVAESLGLLVTWDPISNTVSLERPKDG